MTGQPSMSSWRRRDPTAPLPPAFRVASRAVRRVLPLLVVPWAAVVGGLAAAAGPAATAPAPAAASGPAADSPAAAPARRWVPLPPPAGQLGVADIGMVINVDDPYSVAVGAHYRARRGLSPHQVLEVSLPVESHIGPAAFDVLRRRIDEHFAGNVQALALAWVMPYAVSCNSLAGALALGFDATLCENSCAPSRPSPYFASRSARPWQDHAMRLSMHLAAPSIEQAKALIDRGVAADGTLPRRGARPPVALFVETADRHRNVRMAITPPPGPLPGDAVVVADATLETMAGRSDLLLVQVGAAVVPHLDTLGFVPGALADHLTSSGGRLQAGGTQTSAVEWIAAGATASHGTVSEPCNHLQKFPHPQVLLQSHVHGATAVESYWRSVAWPQQSTFIGEPLAAPFGRRRGNAADRGSGPDGTTGLPLEPLRWSDPHQSLLSPQSQVR